MISRARLASTPRPWRYELILRERLARLTASRLSSALRDLDTRQPLPLKVAALSVPLGIAATSAT